jgi:D-beta-D-heptose 7-phosphate kinase/D-beta-D-heptose 1-phosphate adenosyltransferase
MFYTKLISKEDLKKKMTVLQKENKKFVFTNGCFDLLHPGHVLYLQDTKKLGDYLILAINTDNSVHKLKGETRPIYSEDERAEILSGLACVDFVCLFDEDTPYEIINYLKPDILAKGGDYSLDTIVGRDIVESNGGKVVVIPFVENKSTTNIVQKILSNF